MVTFFSALMRRSALILTLLIWFALLGLNGCATDYGDFNPDPIPPVNPESVPNENARSLPTGPATPAPNPLNQPVNPFGH